MSTEDMYDAVNWNEIPTDAKYVAVYFNGRFAANVEQVQKAYPHARVFTIDVTGADPADCGILDIETGDATPATVRNWVPQRLSKHPGAKCRLYCNLSTWPAVKAEVAGLSAVARQAIRYWVANPTGSAHIVPGSAATQYFWGHEWDTSKIYVPDFD